MKRFLRWSLAGIGLMFVSFAGYSQPTFGSAKTTSTTNIQITFTAGGNVTGTPTAANFNIKGVNITGAAIQGGSGTSKIVNLTVNPAVDANFSCLSCLTIQAGTVSNGGANALISNVDIETPFTASTSTWTVPAGVTSVTVRAWAAGGTGAGIAGGSDGGGGGGGGAYSAGIVTGLTPGTQPPIVVGTSVAGTNTTPASDGGSSSFKDATTVFAEGGKKGTTTSGTGGTGGNGGNATNGFGSIETKSGGKGGNGRNNSSGTGGGGGSSAAPGNNGANGGNGGGSPGGGGNAPAGGGDGGPGGGSGAVGQPGVIPGGGGGGSGDSSTGGQGADGQVIVFYTLPFISTVTVSPNNGNVKVGSVVTVTVHEGNGTTGFTAGAGSTINGVAFSGTFNDLGSGNYSFTYQVSDGDATWALNGLPISLKLAFSGGSTPAVTNSAITGGTCSATDNTSPTIATTTVNPNSGALKVGQSVTVSLTAGGGETGLSVGAGSTINGVAVTGSFTESPAGTYKYSYSITEADADWALNSLPISLRLTDGVGNVSAFKTTFTGGSASGDGHTPTITTATVNPNTGNVHVGQSVVVTIHAGGNETGLVVGAGSTINGIDVTGAFTPGTLGDYTYTYVVGAGDPTWALNGLPISLKIADAAGNLSTAKTTFGTGSCSATNLTIPVVNNHSLGTISFTSFVLTINLSKTGTTFFEVTTSNTPPTAAQIQAGTGPSHFASGNFPIGSAASDITKTITGLNPTTQYWVYTVSEDAVGNQTTPVTSDNATTLTALAEATISNGGGSGTIGSIKTTQPLEVGVFSFDVTDAGGDGAATQITSMIFRPITGNAFPNLQHLIAGAELYDNAGNGPGGVVAINPTDITITTIPHAASQLGVVPNAVTKTYTLKIWLQQPLNAAIRATADGTNLVLSLTDTDVGIFTGGSTLVSSNTNSTTTVDVTATELRFINGATTTFLLNTMSAVTVEATDQYGNRDVGFISSIGMTSTGSLTSAQSATFALGVGTYSTIVHNATGTSLSLQTTGGPSNPTSGPFNINADNKSDIIANTSFVYPTNIQYDTFQESLDITAVGGTSIVVAKFDIRDGGTGTLFADADGAPTILNSLTLDLGANFGIIRRIALYDQTGTNELGATLNEQAIAATPLINFTGLSLSSADAGPVTSFTVRVSFKAAVTDNTTISFKINAAGTSPGASSTFNAGNAGGAITNTTSPNNQIEVLANRLRFTTQPSSTPIGATMAPSPVIKALDALNNLDLDFNSSVDVTSSGTLSSSPRTAVFSGGVGTYNGVIHTVSGSGITLSTNFFGATPPTLPFDDVSSTFTILGKSSDIVENGTFYTSDIAYNSFQENSDITSGSGTSLIVAAFDIRDGGGSNDGDLQSTVLTNLTLNLTNSGLFRRIALYDDTGTNEIAGTEQVVGSSTVVFSGLTLTAPHNGSLTFTVRASFAAPVTDRLQFSVKIGSATAQAGSSNFAAGNAGGAISSTSGNINKIQVTASKLVFTAQPTNTDILKTMSTVSLAAVDNLGSLDTDFGASVDVLSSGVLTVTPQTTTFGSGVGSYNSIVHSQTASGISLTTANGSGLSNPTSNTFNITVSNGSNIIANAGFGYPQDIDYFNTAENSDITNSTTSVVAAKFDVQDGGGSADSDGAPTVLTAVTLDLGANWPFINRVALFDASGTNQLAGATEVAVSGQFPSFSGFSVSAADGTTPASFTVRVSFTALVVDNQQFTIKINSASTQALTSSLFTASNAGGAVTSTALNNNRIEVSASQLVFTTNMPPTVLAGVSLTTQTFSTPVIKALDGNNLLDADYTIGLTLSAASGIPFAPTSLTSVAGVYTFPSFTYTAVGNGVGQLTVTSTLPTITSGAVNVKVANLSTVAAGAAAPALISSLSNSGPPGVVAFNFDVTDDFGATATTNDGLPTLITDVVISGFAPNNTVTNWSQAIAGATLSDGTGNSLSVVPGPKITANTIIFNGIPTASLGLVTKNTTKHYTLSIFLKTALGGSLPTTIDGLQFGFEIFNTSITTLSSGSIIGIGSNTNSGNKNIVDVTATKLNFINPDQATFFNLTTNFKSASLNSNFPGVQVEAVDANGNRDLTFTGATSTVTDITNTSNRTMINGPIAGTTQFGSGPTAGLLTFANNFQYTSGANGNDVSLSLTAGFNNSCGSNYLTGGICGTSGFIKLLASSESQIKGDPTYSFQPTIPYFRYQASNIAPADIVSGTGSYEIARVLLSDGDGDGTPLDQDGAATTLTSLSLAIDGPLGSTLGQILEIALYNGSTELAEKTVTTGDITAGFVQFNGLNIIAPDDNIPTATTISIRVSFKNPIAPIVDRTLLQVKVVNASTTGGSSFFIAPAPSIAGITNGLQAPLGVNILDVIATKLTFAGGQPSAFEGVQEAVTAATVKALDANDILDIDVNSVATVTAPVAPSASPTTTFTFANGILDLATLQYANAGDGTLLVTTTAPAPIGALSSTNTCNHVDVIQITGVSDLGGASGVPSVSPATLQAGVKDAPIFGIQFRSNYNVLGEPKLNSFVVNFSRLNNSTFTNFRVFESTVAGQAFSLGLNNIAIPIGSGGIGASVNPTANSLVINFPTPRPFTPGQTTYTYFVVADVVSTVNGSTPNIQLSILDLGTGTPSAANVVATQGSQKVNVQGPTIGFASVQPPFLVSSYPALAQDNIETGQTKIELTFSVPVFTLDGSITLTDTNNPSSTRTCLVDNSGPFNGDYTTNPASGNAARPIKFIIPGGFLQSDHQYFITIPQGVFSASSKVGIADVNNNVFQGISSSGTLYFRTTNSAAPKLLGATSTSNPVGISAQDINVTNLTSFGATLNATFDKKGTAYFMVLSAAGTPSSAQIKGTTTYLPAIDIVSRGSFPINATTTIAQSGTILPSSGSFPSGTMNVWVYAETTTEADHATNTVPSSPYGGAPDFIQATTGPTTTFTAPPPNTNAPGIQNNANITTNRLAAQFCSGSFQTLNSPIIFYEGIGQTFNLGASQTLNLALPGGFVFDTSTDALGKPIFGSVTLQGADFTAGPNSGTVTFLSPTVLRITFTNSGSTSKDQIILSNLRIFAAVAGSGDLFRLGGNALPTINDGTPVANLTASDARVVNFNNSYSTSLGVDLAHAGTLASDLETAIPDNTLPALVTLRPFVIDSLFDHGPSSFTGQGVSASTNTLNLAGVTKDNPFNITISHTDQNGCTSINAVQYVVYDHNFGIKFSKTTPVLTVDQGPYCASNPAFVIGGTVPAPSPGSVRFVNFDNLTVYNLSTLTTAIPKTSVTGQTHINPTDFGGSWPAIIAGLTGPPSGTHNPPLGGPYFDFKFDDATILNATNPAGTAYVYDLFKATTNTNSNYLGVPGNKGTYYTGGGMGPIEFTGLFGFASNPAVTIKRRQSIDYYIPAIPIVEMVTPYSKLDNGDGLNGVGTGDIVVNGVVNTGGAGLNNPGTMVYCEKGGLININGWPAATAGISTGSFTLVDASNPTNIIYDANHKNGLGVLTPIIPAGFTDNGNGTAVLDPSALTIINNYKDIRVVYTFNENNSPCTSSGYQTIRITPNPTAVFTETAVLSNNTPLTSSFCVGHQINFDASTSSITPVAGGPAGAQNNTIASYDWNFGDINSAVNTATGVTTNHTFNLPQTFAVVLTTKSNWGCSSLPATTNVKVGGIPVVGMELRGVYKNQAFDFYSKNSSVSANDFFARIDWDFGDTHTAFTTYGAGVQQTDPGQAGSTVHNTYASPGQFPVNMKVTSQIGCVNSLTLDNTNPVGKNFSIADDISARTIIVLDRATVVTGTVGYSEDFTATSTWQPWFASNSINPLTFPLSGYSWKQTSGAGGDFGNIIKPDPSILTGNGFWRTNKTNSYVPRERSALYSPSFDISTLNTPMVSYNSLVQLIVSDGVIFEYSTDNLNVADPAKVWKALGATIGEGVGWFTDRGIVAKPGFQSGNDFGWSGATNPNWFVSKHTLDEVPNGILPAPPTNVVFRFALASSALNPGNNNPVVAGGTVFEGFALDNFRIGNRTRTIMLESFASTSNTNPEEKKQSDALASFYPPGTVGTRVIKINYHTNFPANDPFNMDNPADPSSRALYYGIESTPKSRLDGSADPQDRGFDIWGNLTYGIRSLALAQADIVITPTISPGKIKVDVTVTSLLGMPANTILHVAIVEDDIPMSSLSTAQKTMVRSGENNFQYVIKKFLPDAAGTRFGPLLPPNSVSYSFTWELEPSKIYAPSNNLSIVAFVQQEDGIREVYQANNITIPADPAVVTGLEPLALEDIQVYPVPANQEMQIKLPGVLSQPASLQMVDQMGRIAINDGIPQGANSKTVNTRDLSAGVYILQIDVGNGNVTRKKVMVVH